MFVQNYIHGASVVVWQAAVKVIQLLGIVGFNKRKNNKNKNIFCRSFLFNESIKHYRLVCILVSK